MAMDSNPHLRRQNEKPYVAPNQFLHDMGTLCCVSTSQDLKTIQARVKHEGISFLTITLPDFAKDFERSLELGKVDHSLFHAFAFRGGLPLFLGGFLDLVFDRGDGRLLAEPSEDAIYAVRQLSLMFGKIKLECRDDRRAAAFAQFIECELDVIKSTGNFLRNDELVHQYQRVSTLLFGHLFDQCTKRLAWLLPKHGPGSTAERLTSNGKYVQTEWTDRLEMLFPHKRYLSSSRELSDLRLTCVNIREPWNERPVRVIDVPKTLKTPRIIAIEPACMMFMQQGLLEIITEELNRDYILKPLLSSLDQIPNQEMARIGSLTGNLATLDLSEASDRVSNQHVRLMLSNWDYLDQAVQAMRSRKADVPGHGVIHLAKFASMGSALCFAFEAMVFLTVIFVGIEQELRRPLTLKDVKRLRGQVRVYGDDIIVPVKFTRSVLMSLETFGFKVNMRKSFWSGKFRESCGKEYYNGHDVSITRVRRMLPTSRRHVDEIVSAVKLRNHLYKRGMWRSVRYLDSLLEDLIPFPAVGELSSALGKFSFLGYQTDKLDSDTQSPVVKAAVVKHRLPVDKLDDYGALLKFFLKREGPEMDLVVNGDHLERAGRPVSVDIKTRFVSSY